jgi:O-antigen/teichoic acid export membrane protein
MGDNLKEKMVGALKWSTVDRLGQQTVQFAIGVVLARLLSPDDFGLIGIVMIFAALSYVLVDSGFGQALIRKKDASDLDYNTVFFFNLTTSLLLYVLLYFVAPYIAVFFNQPALKSIARVIFLAVVFNSLYLVQFTKLGKKMDFKTLAKINILSTLLSCIVGVGMAFAGFAVWSLVLQQVLFHFLRFLFSLIFVKWKPQFLFSFEVIRGMWRFSINLLGTSVLNVIFNSTYVLILGKFYPKSEVGYYSQGNKLSETFNFTFQSILIGSSYSLFSQIHNDEERFRRIFREITRKTAMITLPVFLVMIAVAEQLIEVVWSVKFLPSVPYFRFLCLAALFAPLYSLNITALNARGESKSTFRIEILKKSLILMSIFVAFPYGISAMLWGYVAASIIAYVFSLIYIKRNLKHFYKHQLQDVIFSLITGLCIALPVFFIGYASLQVYLLLLFQLVVAGLLYIFVLKLFFKDVYLKILSILQSAFRMLKSSKKQNTGF